MRLQAGFLAVLLLAGSLPAAADWLVMRDGSQLETQGPWKKKGAQIIFTSVKGVLSSVRASEVDLDASASVTVAARNAATPAEEEEAEVSGTAAVVITDRDVPQYGGPPPEAESSGEEEAAGTARAAEPAPAAGGVNLEVVSWRHVESEQIGGMEIFGSVRNTGSEIATNVVVRVNLLDEDGNPLANTNAFLRTPAIPPGGTVSFRAPFPGIFRVYGEPEFELTARGLKLEMTKKEQEENDEED
ncbi:MAG: hypothetical protein GY856_54295 [bacterium]|nr:hypothetical protein [bacterium]